MTNILMKEAITAALFAAAVIILLLISRSKRTAPSTGEMAKAASKGAGPVDIGAALKVAIIIGFLTIPVVYHSDSSYSFYTASDASIKVAFKHSGKRIGNCDEAETIRKEGERYRELLKESKHGKVGIEKFAGCPRERFPVVVEIAIDGKKVLDKAYEPTGIEKDMASYISEEFVIRPGVHKVYAALTDSGGKDNPDYKLEETVELKSSEIKLIMFDDRYRKLVIE